MELDRIRSRAEARRRGTYLAQRMGKSLCFVQGDQNIANQAGAAFRSDLNSELQALVTSSQGNSAPGTTYRNQYWHDTTNNVIKRRNAANAAWLVVGTLDETFVLSRSSNTILGLSDIGKCILATSSFTQTLTAAATLGDGWYIDYRNDGTGAITLDPNGAETIDGAATLVLQRGEGVRIWCNGTSFKTTGRSTGMVLLGTGTASASASVVITWTDTTFSSYYVQWDAAVPATGGSVLQLNISTDGGSSYVAGTNYLAAMALDHTSVGGNGGNATDGGFRIGGGPALGIAAAGQGSSGWLRTTNNTFTHCVSDQLFDSGNVWRVSAAHYNNTAGSAINAVKFAMNAGNIASGTFRVYGVR